jgi:hypothetical protein
MPSRSDYPPAETNARCAKPRPKDAFSPGISYGIMTRSSSEMPASAVTRIAVTEAQSKARGHRIDHYCLSTVFAASMKTRSFGAIDARRG